MFIYNFLWRRVFFFFRVGRRYGPARPATKTVVSFRKRRRWSYLNTGRRSSRRLFWTIGRGFAIGDYRDGRIPPRRPDPPPSRVQKWMSLSGFPETGDKAATSFCTRASSNHEKPFGCEVWRRYFAGPCRRRVRGHDDNSVMRNIAGREDLQLRRRRRRRVVRGRTRRVVPVEKHNNNKRRCEREGA